MKLTRVFALMALAGLAGGAHATDGYFSHGYGMKAKGMGGAATATAEDAFGGANNPASMAFVGDRIDLGADLFSPRREASRSGSGGAFDGSAESDSNYFVIPEFAISKQYSPSIGAGITVYGNGGMNSDYPGGQVTSGACVSFGTSGPANLMCGSGRLGVDLMQLIVAPTLAYKLNADHAIGISPLIGYQRFRLEGMQPFDNFSVSPGNVSNVGYDDSFGYGVRIGYQGHLTPTFSIGAAYASKMNFDKFSKYRGLFAEGGDFDIPENYNLGVAWQIHPAILLALDYQRINYSKVAAIGNPSSNLGLCAGGSTADCLGGSQGAGFGWQDVDVWKFGVEYKYSTALTLRAGYNHTQNPITSSDVTVNILAPGVVQDHLTFGMTYALAGGNELTVSYMHAFRNSVTGTSLLTDFGAPSTTTETIKMYQDSIGVAYSWKM
jgi:long-chain fatty acid transport protein